MKYLYSWLRELTDTRLTPEELAEKMTTHAFEVEEVVEIGNELKGVVVGEVVNVEKHPDADKLNVTKVNVGNEELQIVCGAPNVKAGQKVPVALVGTVLPGNFEIRASKIRGVDSFGMICAEDELGIGTEHSGIMVLRNEAKVGTPFADELGIVKDTIIDLSILSNRGHDMLSHIGLAREICAIEKSDLRFDYDGLKLNSLKKDKENSGKVSVRIENEEKCKRYIGVLIENVQIAESPKWIKDKLAAFGMKSINNIVDATNYVMLELGQPMHAFDADSLEKNEKGEINIEVKGAKEGERIVLLDDSEKELSSNDLVIVNNGKTLALAGIMGGKDSGVTNQTKNILIEGANFDFMTIRHSRMKLGVKTNSSDRFEKELDPNLVEKAIARILEIVKETSGGDVVDVVDAYSQKVENWNVEIDLSYLNKLLGCKIAKEDVISIAESLCIEVVKEEENGLILNVPTFRIDLKNQEDIIEEVGRIYGYDHIESQELATVVESPRIDDQLVFERGVGNFLTGNGFSEIYSYSFYSKDDAKNIGFGDYDHLELQKPMNPSQELMQLSLLPNVLKAVSENLKNFDGFRLFQIGREYWKKEDGLPEEKRKLVGVIVVDKDKSAEGFFEARGYIEALLSLVGATRVCYDDFENKEFSGAWHKTRVFSVKNKINKKNVGIVGEISPIVLEKYFIKKRVAVFEIDLVELRGASNPEKKYSPISKYPTMTRDISMIVGGEIRVADVSKIILAADKKLILGVELFDVFNMLEAGKRSLAFHIEFGSKDRTLEGGEVDAIMTKIMNELEGGIGVEIRK